MKKTFFLIGLIGFVLIIGFTVSGCGGGSGPSAVFKQSYAAMQKGDTKTVIALLEPGSAAMFAGLMEEYEAEFKEEMKASTVKTGGIAKIEETITGDTAVLKVTYKDGSSEDQKMVKVDGKWKMSMGK